MLVIKNCFNEDYEFVVTHIDTDAPGCRIKDDKPPPVRIPAGTEFIKMGYEPGESYVVRPVNEPERHRSSIYG